MTAWTRLAAAAIALAVICLPVVAQAQQSEELRDSVVLHDGSLLRGVVVLWEPGVRLVLRDANGHEREFPASEIASVQITSSEARPALRAVGPAAPRATAHLGRPHPDGEPEDDEETRSRIWRIGPQASGGYHAVDDSVVPGAGYFEAGIVLQIRILPELHIRGGFYFWIDEFDSFYDPEWRNPETGVMQGRNRSVGGAGGRGRVLLGVDVTAHLAVRLGIDLGFVPVGPGLMWTGGAVIEVAWRVVAGFAVSLTGGPILRPGRTESFRSRPDGTTMSFDEADHYPVGVRLGVQVEYLF